MTLKVAVLGAGDMGTRHALHWRSVGADVVAVADPDAHRADALAAAVGAAVASDPFVAAADSGADVVSVCTPTVLHVPLIRAAARAGAHVLTEKPLALCEDDLAGLEADVAAAGVTVRVGFMRRFDPVWQAYVREMHDLGGPRLVQASVSAGVRPKRAMHDATLNGGPIVDMACHLTDLWVRAFGRMPEVVTARAETYLHGRPELAGVTEVAPDTLATTFDFGEAGTAQLQLSWGLPEGVTPCERHDAVGPNGRLSVTEAGLTGLSGLTAADVALDAYERQVHAFHAELTTGRPQGLATLADGRRSVRIADALLASARKGAAVTVKEEEP